MNKITTPTKLLVGSFIILIVLLVNILPKKRAQSNLIPSLKAQESPPCDQTTVAGSYGFSGQGVIGCGTPQSAQAVETGVATADGAGKPFRLGHLQPERTNLKHAVHPNVSSEPRLHGLRDNCLRLAGYDISQASS
jgi:hypothetical protein